MSNKQLQTVIAAHLWQGDVLAATGAKIYLVENFGSVTRIQTYQGTMEAKNCQEHVIANAKGVEVIR